MDPIELLVNMIVHGYAVIVAFLLGWLMPRGRHLKRLQAYTLRGVHNFFASEEEYIQSKVQRVKRRISKD